MAPTSDTEPAEPQGTGTPRSADSTAAEAATQGAERTSASTPPTSRPAPARPTASDTPATETKAQAARKPPRAKAARGSSKTPARAKPRTSIQTAKRTAAHASARPPRPVAAPAAADPWSGGRTVALSLAAALEAGAERVAALQGRVADATQPPWLASLIRANADLMREAARTYARTTREMLKT